MKRQRAELSSILRDSSFSDFEKKVYGIVSAIPRGQSRSYKWVAARAGSPGASRAVGNALNKNPYPVVIPCHRVVKSDGSLGGYSKGVSIKKRLLETEGIDCRAGRCYNHDHRHCEARRAEAIPKVARSDSDEAI